MCNLTRRRFARCLASALILEEKVKKEKGVVIDIGFHNRFVLAFEEMSKQLPDYWKPDFEISLCSHSDRGSDDVESMIEEILSLNNVYCSFLRKPVRFLSLSPKRNQRRAQSSLKGLPRNVRTLFRRLSSDLVK